jgi:DNA-directed RNA polymerase specialized sigma24 family protein
LRRQKAIKRSRDAGSEECGAFEADPRRPPNHSGFEREILFRELLSLTRQAVKSRSAEASTRDRLVFELHFFNGLSFDQISQCMGINLSKGGVEKVVKRLIERVQVLASAGKSEEIAP